jgi:2,3-bisphosphoglycerate-independent phosphoglycerate mutase
MDFTLKKFTDYNPPTGPLLLIIADGVGVYRGESDGYPGNAFELAKPENLLHLIEQERLSTRIKAHGTAVGMPSDEDQGNSEVGHNAIGAGRVFAQGARLVEQALESGRLFDDAGWSKVIDNAQRNKTPVHFIGLLSDGNVHSNIAHLCALIGACDKAGIEQVYVHCLLDGRDVSPLSALRYVGELEDYLWTLRVSALKNNAQRRYYIASGGGRMVTTMDRYEADWSIVERGYHAHVLGDGPRFTDAVSAIKALRIEHRADDQYLPHWVVHDPQNTAIPIGPISDGHSVVFFNFRGDRAIEISRAFVEPDFKAFTRRAFPKVIYAGMMEYDGDLHIPPLYLVEPPAIDRTVSEYLARNRVSQYAISETQKYGHVTYFWNGNNSGKFNPEREEWVEIPSDKIAFDQAPEMKAREIADTLEQALRSGQYQFLRVNFANGDMVGHTGSLPAAIQAVQAVDAAVARLTAVVDELGGTLVLTADHGNCEQMIAVEKNSGKPIAGPGGTYKPLTSHTLNPVPFVVRGAHTGCFELNGDIPEPGLGNIAATLLMLLGYEKPQDYLDSLLSFKR